MIHIKSSYTLIVSSCDKYEDLWPAFFKILRAEWPDINCEIVLNTESKSFSYPGLNIITYNLYKNGENVSWTKRLRETLKRVETEYVITLLDDFFMQDRVKTERLQECLDHMEKNPRVKAFYFMETFSKNVKDNKYDHFERRRWIAPYKLNCQGAIWRKKDLIKYLKVDESPWEWETMGNWRTYRYPRDLFYSQIADGEYVFPYIYYANGINWGGLALYRGRWYLPYVEPLFKKHDIKVDFGIRGTVSTNEFVPHVVKKKEDFHGIKRQLYWGIKVYLCLSNCIFVLKNIKHFC